MARTPSHLRKLRKSARLSQRELAHLLGLKSQGVLSDMEAGRKRPGLGVALASAVVFDKSVTDIFPEMTLQIALTVLAAARDLQTDGGTSDAFVADLVERLLASRRLP